MVIVSMVIATIIIPLLRRKGIYKSKKNQLGQHRLCLRKWQHNACRYLDEKLKFSARLTQLELTAQVLKLHHQLQDEGAEMLLPCMGLNPAQHDAARQGK